MFDADISMKSSFLADQIDQTTQNLKKLMPIIPSNDKDFNLQEYMEKTRKAEQEYQNKVKELEEKNHSFMLKNREYRDIIEQKDEEIDE